MIFCPGFAHQSQDHVVQLLTWSQIARRGVRNQKSLEPGFDRRGAKLTDVEKESKGSRTWVR